MFPPCGLQASASLGQNSARIFVPKLFTLEARLSTLKTAFAPSQLGRILAAIGSRLDELG
jgi:hypothetical protein